jgi:hypothetical protein
MCPACLAAAAAFALKAASAGGVAAYATHKLRARAQETQSKPIEPQPSVAMEGDRA